MRRSIFCSLFLAVAAAPAAEIVLSANCTGNISSGSQPYSGHDATAVSCNSVGGYGMFVTQGSATASVTVTGFDIVANAGADSGASGYTSASASASYSTVVSLIVTGGSGTGYLSPLASGGGGQGGFTFVGSSPVPAGVPCFGQNGCVAFLFGAPEFYTLDVTAVAPNNSASIGVFSGNFAFWDSQGTVLSNVQYKLTDADPAMPEAASGILFIVGGSLLWLGRRFWTNTVSPARSLFNG